MALLGTARVVAALAATNPSSPSSFVVFETEILPLWLKRFHVAGGAPHEYSFFPRPHNTQPTIYGSADVLHILYGVNQLNLSTAAGGLVKVEIQDEQGRPIEGFAATDCDPIYTDAIKHVVTWRKSGDVSRLASRAIRLRFVMREADLYSLRFAR